MKSSAPSPHPEARKGGHVSRPRPDANALLAAPEPVLSLDGPAPAILLTGPAREALIRRRAYELYEGNGRLDGHALDDWLTAEAEVSRMMLEGSSPVDAAVDAP